VRRVQPLPPRLETVPFQYLTTVHIEYDRKRVGMLAGQTATDDRAAVLIGAGTIGSHVAESLYREGCFTWSVVDDDFLLPHNLAKHTLGAADTGKQKAVALVGHLKGLRADTSTDAAIVANILAPGDNQQVLDAALSSAAIVLDGTASVAASRKISDIVPAAGRAGSFFFNPNGTAVVLLLEDAGRTTTLRELEARYYRMILKAPALAEHLAVADDALLHTGACRALTNAIPESRAAILSGLVANALGARLAMNSAFAAVWSLLSDGGVHCVSCEPDGHQSFQRGDWTVVLDDSTKAHMHRLRAQSLPAETGGVLIGILDTAARRMHIVQALPAPPDSRRSRAEFERGIQDLTQQVRQAAKATMGQVRYLGEWHSHPKNSTTHPSITDIRQLAWLAGSLAPEGIPALMMIVGDDDIEVIMAKMEG
jgi:integrative and conjugative element protein (TIGR02256 family)